MYNRVAICALLVILVSSAAFAQTAVKPVPQGGKDKSPRKFFGKGSPFTEDDLPEGKLKAKLKTLSPAAKGKAMQWLHRITFPSFDAAKHLRVDNDGGIYYVCPDSNGKCEGLSTITDSAVEAVPVEVSKAEVSIPSDEIVKNAEPETAQASIPSSTPPVYSSKPGAPNTIYLDFNGGNVSGKRWNTEWGVALWENLPFSIDGDTTTFTDTEQTAIRQVWERVSEDYAPFNVNVTTDKTFDPDTYTGDKNKVAWAIICNTTDKTGKQCPHYDSGGIAYLDVFGISIYASTYQPAWVVPTATVADMAEAASHEVGHNLSLVHDGTGGGAVAQYYGGHGTGDTSWGPLMGTGYGRNVSQWSKGEYYNSAYVDTSYQIAPGTQDDLAEINSRIPYRPDDHGDANGTATELVPGGDGSISQTGIIETTADPDVFSFATGAGSITLNAATYVCATGTKGGNLDINLELYNSVSALVASNNSATLTAAGITTTVPAGTYFLYVKPSAAGSPLSSTPTGYTIYGSLGKYTLTGSIILPGIAVIESGGSTVVTEGGATDTYSIALGTAPLDNVTVTITPNSQVSVNKSSVIFTTSNWSTQQIVTVTAVNDATEEGPHFGTITHNASSSDPAFNGIIIAGVTAQVTDNDYIGLTSPNGGDEWIAGTTNTITWFSLMGGNVKIDLLKNSVFLSSIVASTTNDGSHAWSIPANQTPGTNYKIRITSVETPAKLDASDSNVSIFAPPTTIYFANMDANPPGWNMNAGWAFGQPTGADQDGKGNPDPTSGYNGQNVIGYNLAGDYEGGLTSTRWASTPSMSCSGYQNVTLRFWRWLGVEGTPYDNAFIQVSSNWTSWTTVWRNSDVTIDDSSWVLCEYDISAFADGRSTVYVRWGLGTTDVNAQYGDWNYCGWNLDDVLIEGSLMTPNTGIRVTQSGGTTAVTEGGTNDTYNMVLISAPSSNVVVTITPDSQVGTDKTSLTFTTGNWSTTQTVSVTAFNDTLHEFTHTGVILHSVTSADAAYNGMLVDGITVNITDNDNSGPTVLAGPGRTVYITGDTWSPTSLAPVGWFDASDTSTVIKVSGKVSQWRDKSGRTNHLNQSANAVKRPISTSFEINGLSTITFDGVDDELRGGANPFGSSISNAFVIAVLKPGAFTNSTAFTLTGLTNSVNRWQGNVPWDNGSVYFDCGGLSGANRVSYTHGWSNGVDKLMGFYCSVSANVQELWENGTKMASDSSGHAATVSSGWAFGSANGTNYDDCSFGEAIIIKGTITAANRQILEGYLAHKWGLDRGLPADHPYKVNDPDGATAMARLDGTVSDADGDPLTTTWAVLSGPGPVKFDNPNAVDTIASFKFTGVYTLRLTAADTLATSSNDVVITVMPSVIVDNDADAMDDGWETAHTVSNPAADSDFDGVTDYEEFIAGTNPKDGTKYLEIESVYVDGSGRTVVVWSSDQDGTTYERRYKIQKSLNLMNGVWSNIIINVLPSGVTTERADPSPAVPAGYYRIVPY